MNKEKRKRKKKKKKSISIGKCKYSPYLCVRRMFSGWAVKYLTRIAPPITFSRTLT
jgi:hypothetical protein